VLVLALHFCLLTILKKRRKNCSAENQGLIAIIQKLE